jgi:hypothetical protein
VICPSGAGTHFAAPNRIVGAAMRRIRRAGCASVSQLQSVIYNVVFFHLLCQKQYFGDLGFSKGMDKRGLSERDICTFPSPADLWAAIAPGSASTRKPKGYFDDGSGEAPRYCQVNAAIEAIGRRKRTAVPRRFRSRRLELSPLAFAG